MVWVRVRVSVYKQTEQTFEEYKQTEQCFVIVIVWYSGRKKKKKKKKKPNKAHSREWKPPNGVLTQELQYTTDAKKPPTLYALKR